MEMICPLCNGLIEYKVECSNCNGGMEDKGRISNFYDDYSSYLDMGITELIDGVPNDKCVHLFYCLRCNNDKRITIDKIIK